jgi:hypothetical protein
MLGDFSAGELIRLAVVRFPKNTVAVLFLNLYSSRPSYFRYELSPDFITFIF